MRRSTSSPTISSTATSPCPPSMAVTDWSASPAPWLRPGRMGFDVHLNHVATEDNVVLTDRVDEISFGRFAVAVLGLRPLRRRRGWEDFRLARLLRLAGRHHRQPARPRRPDLSGPSTARCRPTDLGHPRGGAFLLEVALDGAGGTRCGGVGVLAGGTLGAALPQDVPQLVQRDLELALTSASSSSLRPSPTCASSRRCSSAASSPIWFTMSLSSTVRSALPRSAAPSLHEDTES